MDIWCKEIDDEERLKEQEVLAHAKWLKERDLRKQEIERTWRPMLKVNTTYSGHKRKASDSVELSTDIELEESPVTITEPPKTATSPLLTSLLKSPSHALVQNVATSSILHSAITSQRSTTTNPTIASLLNSSTNVTVSPGLQQLVSCAIAQEPAVPVQIIQPTSPELPDDAVDILPNLKVEDIESTILASNEPLPEIKNEEVEVIISDLIESADIVTDPEEHLNLDGNVDLMDNLENELQELVKEEEENAAKDAAALEQSQQMIKEEKEPTNIDPFEFQDDTESCDQTYMTKQSTGINEIKIEQCVEIKTEVLGDEEKIPKEDAIKEVSEELSKDTPGGSVEIVEVVMLEDEEIDKNFNKSQIEDIVHSSKSDPAKNIEEKVPPPKIPDEDAQDTHEPSEIKIKLELDVTKDSDTETGDNQSDNYKLQYNEELYDDNIMEVKIDKSGKIKRDYSRTKKKDDKDFDFMLNIDGVKGEEDLLDAFSDKEFQDVEKKSNLKNRIRQESDRSNSPWTEEEDVSKVRRRYSTPATPTDSIPNSPCSASAIEDDREHRIWKKSVLLVYNRLTAHKYASLFLKPITDEQAPGYHNIILRPMDLHTIRKNIENGSIKTSREFLRDVLLMFNNAMIYNKTNDHIYNVAQQMQKESLQQIQILFQAQSDIPARRETRTSEPNSKRKRGHEENVRVKKRKDE